MCAINGVWGSDTTLLAAMQKATLHRGPDGTGVWSNGAVSLGSNRLAILDLSPGANMPMVSASGRFVIVYNGEIYNHRELRKKLSAYPFKTHSDTEVILALWQERGPDALPLLDGMFALAVWDNEKRELVLARDRMGIKPLYYRSRGAFAFSSELKGLLADAHIPRTINPDALERYLRMRYVPGSESIIADISRLPAGHVAVVKEGKVASLKQYATVPLAPLVEEPREAIEEKVRSLIDDAVGQQLIADRPVGLFLSGGLDSSIVLDAASRHAARVETFSLGFELSAGEDPDKFNADALMARQTAAHYGALHREVTLSEEDFLKLLPETIYALDEPLGNATAVAQLALARFARQHIIVALAGDGGDELFGGYPRYRLSRFMDMYARAPQALRRALGSMSAQLRKLDTPAGVARIERFMFEKDDLLARVVVPQFISPRPAQWFEKEYLADISAPDFAAAFMDADRRGWLVDEALARTDATSMAASLEARVPLLSQELAAYASRLPGSLRVGLQGSKPLLRSAFKNRLPAHVLQAHKRGFFSPVAKWLRRPEVLKLAREALSKGFHPPTDALLNFAGAAEMLDAHVEKRQYAMSTLWMLVAFRLWAKQYNATL